jgi:hypothetical protein
MTLLWNAASPRWARRGAGIVALACLVVMGACDVGPVTQPPATQPPVTSHGGPVRDHVTLLDALRRRGLTVNPVSRVEQPFLTVTGEAVEVNGETIQVYEYSDEAAADRDAAKIQPDGSVSGTQITWTAKPHFYRSGLLIVIYPGTDATVLAALEAELGKPFAVGN